MNETQSSKSRDSKTGTRGGGEASAEVPREAPFDGLNVAGHTGECPYACPVCAAIGIVKQMSPDVSAHLAAAAREFILAAKAFLDGVAEREREQNSQVEKIPLD